MAVRIRKLARELDRTPAEVIGVLHALGFQRYRSADDMINSVVEAKLRRGLAQGVEPVDVALPEREVAPDSVEAVAQGGVDLMSQLVPGVVPAHATRDPGRRLGTPAPSRPPAPPAPRATPRAAEELPPAPSRPEPTLDDEVARRSLEVERAALASMRRTIESERAILEADRSEVDDLRRRLTARERSLESERSALDELRVALEGERASLQAERDALDAHRQRVERTSVPLESLLEARGLRGSDEFERALVALARGRHLRDVLWSLHVEAPEHLTKVLEERLVLVPGDVPDAVIRGAASVAVAPERADVPDGGTLGRWLTQVGERLLLHGHRRLLVIGGRSRWQRLIREAVDARIETRFAPPQPRTRAMALEDVAWADVIVLWSAPVEDAARAIYAAGRPDVIEVEGEGLSRFFEGVFAALQP